MAIITLLSDMGTSDHYVAAVKGAILSQLPGTTIVDISHHIAPFNNMHAAFVLRNAWPEFPEGTVHVIGVNPEADRDTAHLAVRHGGHFFIGADNGIFALLFEGKPMEAFELTVKPDHGNLTFPNKYVFVKAACHLARGGTVEMLGRRTDRIREQVGIRPVVMDDTIKGEVVHVDHYGNVVTNITKPLFDSLVRGRPFRISFGRSADDILKVHTTYSDVPQGERVAFFGDSGHLEIAVNKGVTGSGGGAAQLLGLRVTDTVRLELSAATRTVANA